MNEPVPTQPAEQERYARWLEWGARTGLVVLIAGFFGYAFGLLPALVPPEKLQQWWGLPVAQYLQQSGAPQGWGWLAQLHRGDMLGMLGIAILAGCSLPALLALVPLYARRGERTFMWMCLAEVAVVLLAASGLLAGGH